jgi:hypothetical protein
VPKVRNRLVVPSTRVARRRLTWFNFMRRRELG